MTVELLSAMAYDLETFEEDGYPDPSLHVLGELPARTKPFGINRVYQAPQGMYEESVLIVDPDDVVLWQRPYRFIECRGEMHEDLFDTRVGTEVEIEQPGEHHLVFLINGAEAGRVPIFITAKGSAKALGVVSEAAQTALKKGSILWVSIPQPDGSVATRPAWYVQKGNKVFLMKGPGEQELPHLEDHDSVAVTIKSKEVKAAIATMRGDVRVVANDSEEFTSIATQGMGNRLNLPDGQGALERWRDTCTLVELTLEA